MPQYGQQYEQITCLSLNFMFLKHLFEKPHKKSHEKSDFLAERPQKLVASQNPSTGCPLKLDTPQNFLSMKYLIQQNYSKYEILDTPYTQLF